MANGMLDAAWAPGLIGGHVGESAKDVKPGPTPARVPADKLIARYLVLFDRRQAGHYHGHPDTPEIKSALHGAMADIWRGLHEEDRVELAVALARKGAEPVTIEEVNELAKLVEGDALALRREAHKVAAAFVGGRR